MILKIMMASWMVNKAVKKTERKIEVYLWREVPQQIKWIPCSAQEGWPAEV